MHETNTAAGGDAVLDRERELGRLTSWVRDGVPCQIVGPAGVGKSTLLQLLAGSARDDRGITVEVIGLRDLPNGCELESSLASVLEEPSPHGARRVICLDDADLLETTYLAEAIAVVSRLRTASRNGDAVVLTARVPVRLQQHRGTPEAQFLASCQILHLGLLSPMSAQRLIRLRSRHGAAIPESVTEEITTRSNGHPALLVSYVAAVDDAIDRGAPPETGFAAVEGALRESYDRNRGDAVVPATTAPASNSWGPWLFAAGAVSGVLVGALSSFLDSGRSDRK